MYVCVHVCVHGIESETGTNTNNTFILHDVACSALGEGHYGVSYIVFDVKVVAMTSPPVSGTLQQ